MEESEVIGSLLALLDSLPASFAKGSREQLAVRDLVWRLIEAGQMPEDAARLKTLIAPLVCGNPDQQKEFYSRFEEWVAPKESPAPLLVKQPKKRWPAIAAAAVFAVMAGSVAYVARLLGPIPEIGGPRPPGVEYPAECGADCEQVIPEKTIVSGRVVESGGLPVANATVRIPVGVGAGAGSFTTDRLGRFSIELVQPASTATSRAPLVLKDSAAGVAFSPDGTLLASVGKTVNIWNAATGTLLQTLIGHQDEVYGVAFSPDGRTLATCGKDSTARLWDLKSGRQLHILRHGNEVLDVAFSPDGRTLATASGEGRAGIWDVATGKQTRSLSPLGSVYGLAFSRDGATLVTASDGEEATIWDWRGGKKLDTLTLGYRVLDVDLSPDGARIATVTDTEAKVWDAATDKQTLTLGADEDLAYFGWRVRFDPSGRRVAVGGGENNAGIWDAKTGRRLRTFRLPGSPIRNVAIAFSPDGRMFATGADDVRIWDLGESAPGAATALNLLVTHANYEPAYVENVSSGRGPTIKLGPMKAGRMVWARVAETPARRYPPWVSGVLAAIPLAAAIVLFLRLRKRDRERKAFLEKFETHLDLAPVRVHSRSQEDELFQGPEVAALALDLRRRRPEPTSQIAIEPTIRRTSERAGVFTPVHRERYGAREYLAMIEAKNGNDHQARYWGCLMDRLAARDVWIDRYQFSGDPRVCEEPGAERTWITLEEIASLHPRHELWVLSEAERFFDRATRTAAPWLTALSRWTERAVLRLTEGSAEDCDRLESLGFGVAPATVAGIGALNPDAVRAPAERFGPAYPLVLEEDEARWLQGPKPKGKAGRAELRMLDRQLRAWLGPNGYVCLLACSVYPGVAWNLTLHLALALIPEDERDETLARLVRLPWFRYGRMPQWLREFLTGKLDAQESARVTKLLEEFLENKKEQQARRSSALEFVKITQDLEDRRKPPTRDYVFLSYLLGRKPRLRDIEAPDWLRRLLYPEGLPALNLRREWWLVAGLVVSGVAGYAAERFAYPPPKGQKWVRIAAPAAGEKEPVNPLAARALEIAASRLDQAAVGDHAAWSFDKAVQFAGPKGDSQPGRARPGAVFQPSAKDQPAALVEEVASGGGLILLQPVGGAVRRVFRRAEELKGTFVELGAGMKINPVDGLTYVWIPPGTFMMGCSPGDSECSVIEKPAHQVTLTRGFWMGQTEVTQQAYQKVTGGNPSTFQGQRLPVESVTWYEAQGYCGKVGLRLPTEAEWEYAERAGDAGVRYGAVDAIGWYKENSSDRTHEVRQKLMNAFGLYDMLGNVFEWLADWYGTYTPGAAIDPQGPSGGDYRVLRGGGWISAAVYARASTRGRDNPLQHFDNAGFRCAGN